jgi:hypothetical protein
MTIGLATKSELVWGTYFLLEALLALTGGSTPPGSKAIPNANR